MKADTEIIEEIGQSLKRLTSRLDETHNGLKSILSEMSEDAEFLLNEQSFLISDRLQAAITKIERTHYIGTKLANILIALPGQYQELENQAKNELSDLIVILEQLKSNSVALKTDQFIVLDCFSTSMEKDIEGEALVRQSNIALSTSLVQNQLKITGVEDIEDG